MQAASPASGRAFSRSNARSIAGASRSGVWLQVKVHPPVSGVWCASHYTCHPGQLEHPFERPATPRCIIYRFVLHEQRGARGLIFQKNKSGVAIRHRSVVR